MKKTKKNDKQCRHSLSQNGLNVLQKRLPLATPVRKRHTEEKTFNRTP